MRPDVQERREALAKHGFQLCALTVDPETRKLKLLTFRYVGVGRVDRYDE